jgi:pimeloyl-ACP methyl ester carboxylesterase
MLNKSDYALIGGAQIYYEVAGEGDALVLLHAGICDSRMWDEQFAAFAEHHRVMRYDRRGFGKTEMVAGAYANHRDLYELLKFLEIERACLVGCSQGGKTSIDFALEHPEMVNALILVASALGGFSYAGDNPTDGREWELAEEAGDVDRVNELELQMWVDGPRRTPEQVDTKMRELVREMNRIALAANAELGEQLQLEPPAVERLGEIHTPTLIIIGDIDTPETIAAANVLEQNISGSRKVVMTGTAHLPNMERPDEFNRHVLSFLNNYSFSHRDTETRSKQ